MARQHQGHHAADACGGGYQDFSGNIGTPVIDSASGTLYVVASSTTGVQYAQHLHAVSITDGHELAGSPTAITATANGTGRRQPASPAGAGDGVMRRMDTANSHHPMA